MFGVVDTWRSEPYIETGVARYDGAAMLIRSPPTVQENHLGRTSEFLGGEVAI